MKMKLKKIKERIGSVDIISENEQIAFVTTNVGNYIVGYIPDAKHPINDWKRHVLAKVDSIDEAENWFKNYRRL